MQLKKYTIASLILILLVAGYTFAAVTQDGASLDLWFIKLPYMPAAALVALAMFILFVASLFHMIYYSFKKTLADKKDKKDYETLVDAIVDAYLAKENRTYSYKTARFKTLGALVDSSSIFTIKDVQVSDSKKITDVLGVIDAIKRGEVAELKSYKLPISNEYVIQNERNRYKKGDLSAENILGSSSKYDKKLALEVYKDFAKTAPLASLEKYKEFMSKDALFTILSRINAPEDTLIVPNETLIPLLKLVELDRDEYVKVAKILSKHMLPDQRMKLFEMLSGERDFITDAYLYTLFDLEMLSLARELLNNTQDNEYVKFKIFSNLRENEHRYNIEYFI
ncbi:MAG: hypothetical protein WC144_07080 [Sulfurimonas sp.]|jgi:hypothetical protein|nr:hypothetical protein [Sulfurimonadaceae bacterium]